MTVVDLQGRRQLAERLERLLLQIETDLRNNRHDVAVTNFCHALHLAHQVSDTDGLKSLRAQICRAHGGLYGIDGGAA